MLTWRGWWLFLFVLGMLAVAMLQPRPNAGMAVLALTVGLWFAWEWLLFAIRVRLMLRRLRFQRELRDERGPVDTLWSGRTFQVRVTLELPSGLDFPYVLATDRLPFGVEVVQGQTWHEGSIEAGHPVVVNYGMNCEATGLVRFEGLSLQLADPQGFFFHAAFLRGPVVFRVLPSLADSRGHAPTVKRHNLLPPPGVHRLRRPGSGSELLDLRDYLPGDPPKTIAWKASARRDRLITKEFESEVPVRCTLFVDTSNAVRLGPAGHNALTGLVEIASAVAQASVGNRDLVGLCLFDDQDSSYIRPARGTRHLIHVLHQLADAADLAPSTGKARLTDLLPLSYAFVQEVYPDLLTPDLNRVPFWLPWLTPQPAYTIPEPTLTDRMYRYLPFIMAGHFLVSILVLVALIFGAFFVLDTFEVPLLAAILLLGFGGLAGLVLVRIPMVFYFPQRRRFQRWRKQLAAVLSVQYGLAPGGLAALMEDDEAFVLHLQRFLADHQVPYPLPLYDRRGHYLFAAAGKVEVLAAALVRSIGKGHDNELFVLLADLLELTEELDPLVKAVKVALARHHRVVVICPWPPGIPPLHFQPAISVPLTTGTKRTNPKQTLGMLRQATVQRFHRAFQRLQRTFAHLGVPVISSRSGDPSRLILERLDRLRGVGRRR